MTLGLLNSDDGVPEHSGRRPNFQLSYWQHCEAVTGLDVGEDPWLDARAKAQELEDQDEQISRKLEAVGIPTRRKISGDLCLVGVFSGIHSVVVPRRHINFLPSMMSANRRQLVKRLSYYAESRPYLRYLVFTNGSRCTRSQLRSRLQDLARSISRLAARPELKEWGVTVELRVSEFTAKRETDGAWSYHPHANVIINCSRIINWSKLHNFILEHSPGSWQDNGRLVDPKEAIKYFVKPADVVAHNYRETRELFSATFGLHLVAPMSGFRDFTLSLKEKRVKLSKVPDKSQTWRWTFVDMREKGLKAKKSGAKSIDQVLALVAAQPRFTSRFEPVLLVRNFSGSVANVLQVNQLTERFELSKAAWNSRKAGSGIRFTPSPQLSGDEIPRTGQKQRDGPRLYHLVQKV